eukprot:SAG31_NODE_7359_length_1711_cov_1.023573_3_plen_138_part_01
MKRLLRELGMDDAQAQHGLVKCDLQYAQTVAQGQKLMQKAVAQLQKERGSAPMVLVLQSAKPLHWHTAHMPALVDMPCVLQDQSHADSVFPALGWETPAVKTMLRRSMQVDEWWEPQLQVANYSQIPVGNLETDVFNF